jgi:hypothetical protein
VIIADTRSDGCRRLGGSRRLRFDFGADVYVNILGGSVAGPVNFGA